MELLIPGLILVALMAYLSTRIKRSAAKAYEEENITREEFSIRKPAGFISPVEPGEGLLFAAYSREYGSDESGKMPQVAARVRSHAGTAFEGLRKSYAEESANGLTEEITRKGSGREGLFRFVSNENGVVSNEFVKLIETGGYVLELRVSALNEALKEPETEFSPKIKIFLESFCTA